jgi:type II secretory pathway pseudopilin PulG
LQRSRRTGITLIESLVAVTITAIAGTALFSAIGASLGSSYSTLNKTIGTGLADQMLDELTSVRFPTTSDTRSAYTSTRYYFDDLDDYHKWSSSPPVHKNGFKLGQSPMTVLEYYPVSRPYYLQPETDFLNRLTREVSVERIRLDASNNWIVTSDNTDYRRVTVKIKLKASADLPNHEIAEATRIFSYIPLSP